MPQPAQQSSAIKTSQSAFERKNRSGGEQALRQWQVPQREGETNRKQQGGDRSGQCAQQILPCAAAQPFCKFQNHADRLVFVQPAQQGKEHENPGTEQPAPDRVIPCQLGDGRDGKLHLPSSFHGTKKASFLEYYHIKKDRSSTGGKEEERLPSAAENDDCRFALERGCKIGGNAIY